MTNQPTNTSPPVAEDPFEGAKPYVAKHDVPEKSDDLIRKRRRKKTKNKKLRVAVIILIVLLVLAGLGTAFALNLLNTGKQSVQGAMQGAQVEAPEEAVTYDEGKTVKHNGHTYALNENMVSIVVIGYDRDAPANEGEKPGQADAVMVLALDTQSGEVTAIGIPRDSMVDVSEFVGDAFIGQETMQLCLAFSYGDGKETSSENTLTAVSRILYNMPMSYYIALNESGIAPLNDSIGGVALTALQTVPGTNVIEGQDTVLFGYNAYRYVQWRDISILNSSLDRQARQVQYIKAFTAQALEQAEGNLGVFVDLFALANEYSITNLGASEFSYLISKVLENKITSLNVATLAGELVQGEKFAEFYLDKSGIYQTVLDVYYQQVD